VKVSERNSVDLGGKNAPFPAWVLHYANQPVPLPFPNVEGSDADKAEEQKYAELSHFEEVQPTNPLDTEPAKDETSTE
jgi:hypothetical protein